MKQALVLSATAAISISAAAEVVFNECPRCEMEIRVSHDAKTAYVNLSKLGDATKEDRAARAERLLAAGRIPAATSVKRPLMGWSSWNTFACDISEDVILETARAMATNGLKDAGYVFVNIDDGFFWGHGEDGRLRFNPNRFPNGMKPVVDGIHALGLKAGIYSDAGADTCGSMWQDAKGRYDKGGVGGGLYGHDEADCNLHFKELGFDFIKVDYCGGLRLGLEERTRYTQISQAIRATGRTDVRLNICRWSFPGTWAADVAESWRTTGDIRANWGSLKGIIRQNLYLSAYARPGAYNDMDMMEVGHLKGSVKTNFGSSDEGFTPDEEVLHFGAWCLLSSPLLIGCDARNVPETTMALLTNPYLLAMEQNDLGLQAEVVARPESDVYVLAKDADRFYGTARYVAVFNLADAEKEVELRSADFDLGGKIETFDLVERADPGSFRDSVFVRVRPHAGRFFRFDAEKRLERRVYEAECAFLTDFNDMRDWKKLGTVHADEADGASGGVVVRNLGFRETNDMIWKRVNVHSGGRRELVFRCAAPKHPRFFHAQVDGGRKVRVDVLPGDGQFVEVSLPVEVGPGVHTVRLSNAEAWMPDMDRMVLK